MIEWFILICFFLLGIILGSFYNVLGLRIPKNESIVFPGSHCTKCNHDLKWYDLIPLFSYLFLKGKCRYCHSKISWLYPFNEFVCGLLFSVSYYSFGFSYELIIALTLSSLLVLVIASDVTYMIIPDRFTFISSLIIIVVKLLDIGVMDTLIAIGSGLISFSLMYLLMMLGNFLFKKETLGGADIKLMFLIGLVVHPIIAMLVVVIASFIALPSSLIVYYKNKEHAIAFGPFLVIGLLIMYFTKINVMDIINFL